jgi:hypothetical protein
VGRPTKQDAETEQRILTALRTGNTRKAAAAYGRIDESTLERWMRRNAGFAGRVKLAEAEAHVNVVARLVEQIQAGDVQAMRFWLERRHGSEWGPPKIESHVDVTGTGVQIYLPARAEQPSSNGNTAAAAH